MFNSEWNDKAWTRVIDSVKTGETAFVMAHGMPVSDWLERNPQAAKIFNEANAVKAATAHRSIVDVYDFFGIDCLIDVGGGIGALMAEILTANPSMKGIVADTPLVIKVARNLINARGLEGRCDAVECDFFSDIPTAGDAYLLSNVLHDWSDDRCGVILNNCYKAMNPDSKLLIVEMIIPSGSEFSVAKLLDLEMLVITGGRERTQAEFESLLDSSGFSLSRIIPTQAGICVIEARRS